MQLVAASILGIVVVVVKLRFYSMKRTTSLALGVRGGLVVNDDRNIEVWNLRFTMYHWLSRAKPA